MLQSALERKAAGEITRDCDVIQIFRASRNALAVVSPVLANYAARRTGHIGLRLHELPDDWPIDRPLDRAALASLPLVASLDERAEAVPDNCSLDFFFDPITHSAGRLFALHIFSDDASAGNALTVWLTNGGDRIDRHARCWVGGVDQGLFGLVAATVYAPAVVDGDVPEMLNYSPVTQCNLNCVHCISRETRKGVVRMAQGVKDQIRQWCADGKVKLIWTDYSGDILWADARFGGELEFLTSLGVPFCINTSGTHMTADVSARLMKANVPQINVSIDAARDETYHRIRRGSPPLVVIHDNIRDLVAARAAAGKTGQVHLGMSFTLMRSNLDEWPEFIRQAARLGVDVISARHLEAYTPDMEGESLWLDQQRFNTMREVAVAVASELGIEQALPSPFEDLEPREGHQYCLAPWSASQILGNGDVMACCVPRTKMGNLHEQSMGEIWNGPVYRAFRLAVNSSRPPEMCRSCPIFRKTNNPDSYLVHRTMHRWRSPWDEAKEAARRAG
jgi:radical SAM protein with 4Fe4S-binding SPASM domain